MPEATQQSIDARRAVSAARRAIAGNPRLLFFTKVLYSLLLEESSEYPTMATDGERILYNPDFTLSLSAAEVQFVLIHETLHVANLHPWRESGREHNRWNAACDFAINPIVSEFDLTPPKGLLFDSRYTGKSAERIYSLLPQQQEPNGGNNGKPGEGGGDVIGNSDVSKRMETAARVVSSARAAKQAGKLPASLQRLVESVTHPPARSLVSAVVEYLQQEISRDDYTYTRPSRRYAASGLYLPSLRSEKPGTVVTCVDTSGSITPDLLNRYVHALQYVLDELLPSKLVAIACDAEVHETHEFSPGDTLAGSRFSGGGGTDFRPAIVEAARHNPVALVYLTDLEGYFPAQAPDFPVLWAVYDNPRAKAPFGRVIYIE